MTTDELRALEKSGRFECDPCERGRLTQACARNSNAPKERGNFFLHRVYPHMQAGYDLAKGSFKLSCRYCGKTFEDDARARAHGRCCCCGRRCCGATVVALLWWWPHAVVVAGGALRRAARGVRGRVYVTASAGSPNRARRELLIRTHYLSLVVRERVRSPRGPLVTVVPALILQCERCGG